MSVPLLPTGTYTVYALHGRKHMRSIGVRDTEEPFEHVRLEEPYEIWQIKEVDARDLQIRFVLQVGGYDSTGVMVVGDEARVTVSRKPEANEEWVATYRKGLKGFTVALARDPSKAWMVSHAKSHELSRNPQIVISELKRPFTHQLFRFEWTEEY